VLFVVSATEDARAIDPFEIQVYDGTADAPGQAGLELHVNRVMNGLRTSAPPELPMNHQTHFTLEPSIGVTRFLELGAYLQSALRADGTFDYGGAKARAKFSIPQPWSEHLRFGVNVEVSLLPERYERSRWGSEIRPIVAYEDDHWLLALNPIVDVPLGPPDARSGPTIEPAAMAKAKLRSVVAVGVEYYSSFGPIASPLAWNEQAHYLYEAVDLLALPRFELNAGIGEGLTSASNALVAKMIVGYTWDVE
jgi:hypothetical protein